VFAKFVYSVTIVIIAVFEKNASAFLSLMRSVLYCPTKTYHEDLLTE